MKKHIFIAIFIAFYSITFSQNQKIEYSFQDKNNHKCTSTLYIINNTESLYRINDERESGVDKNSNNDNMIYIYNDAISTIFYSGSKKTITRIPLYKNEIIYSDLNSKIKYKLTGKKKKIYNYNCQEAKLNLNGRKYNIWFTPDVETNFGPFKINNLPGLLIELYEETNKTKITFKSIKKLTDLAEYNKYKKYILSKTALSYNEYESKTVKVMTAKKSSMISKAKEFGATVNFSNDQSAFTEFIIDIPTNLVSELQKIN